MADALESVRSRVLARGVFALAAMMPWILWGCQSRPWLLVLLYGMAAAVCIAMLLEIGKRQSLLRDQWQDRSCSTALRSGLI